MERLPVDLKAVEVPLLGTFFIPVFGPSDAPHRGACMVLRTNSLYEAFQRLRRSRPYQNTGVAGGTIFAMTKLLL